MRGIYKRPLKYLLASTSFKDYLLKLKDILTDAYKYHALPLDALLSESQATIFELRIPKG
jgi:hypothetical protein